MKCSKCGFDNNIKNQEVQPAVIQKEEVKKGTMPPKYPHKDIMDRGKDMNKIYKKVQKLVKSKK